MKYLLPLAVCAVCILVSAAPAPAQEAVAGHPGTVEKFDPARDPAADVQVAVIEAKRTGKRILLDVGGEWCIWCRRLDTLFMKNPDLSDQLHAGFVTVKVNYSKENKNEKFFSAFPKVPGYPHLFVLDQNGKLLHSQDTGVLESGKGYDRAKIVEFMTSWGKPYVKQDGGERH